MEAGVFDYSSVFIKFYEMKARPFSTRLHDKVENMHSALDSEKRIGSEVHGCDVGASVRGKTFAWRGVGAIFCAMACASFSDRCPKKSREQ